MLISLLAATVFANPAAQPPAVPTPLATATVDHGKLNWFSGSFEEALALAASSKKLVFIDFWTEW